MLNRLKQFLNHLEGKNKTYVSEADKLLQSFDREHPARSTSQEKEIAKHRNIFYRKTDSRIKW